uniref:Uncharacterized protein n=1 Tax=Chromera velia CCMP2878 TaxID=1169474 RepID=A0A0K6S864_9ALVE|eukprot:Cvel_24361.t1-p1 / transcript=Cvel_24361.t1 / gene=Cvel_24361 / organism=Chromera_velia_CCMP2878 / gene_product=hypothetical protein / transcript_product=hypothetical protein / location=Cvel_scaffold2622:5563-12099(-) / protein_length=436 / sequence_SO=supercontig / SO=protein_coding / is_pseudo=false
MGGMPGSMPGSSGPPSTFSDPLPPGLGFPGGPQGPPGGVLAPGGGGGPGPVEPMQREGGMVASRMQFLSNLHKMISSMPGGRVELMYLEKAYEDFYQARFPAARSGALTRIPHVVELYNDPVTGQVFVLPARAREPEARGESAAAAAWNSSGWGQSGGQMQMHGEGPQVPGASPPGSGTGSLHIDWGVEDLNFRQVTADTRVRMHAWFPLASIFSYRVWLCCWLFTFFCSGLMNHFAVMEPAVQQQVLKAHENAISVPQEKTVDADEEAAKRHIISWRDDTVKSTKAMAKSLFGKVAGRARELHQTLSGLKQTIDRAPPVTCLKQLKAATESLLTRIEEPLGDGILSEAGTLLQSSREHLEREGRLTFSLPQLPVLRARFLATPAVPPPLELPTFVENTRLVVKRLGETASLQGEQRQAERPVNKQRLVQQHDADN